MNKDKQYFTQLIKSKGWGVKPALDYWGRSYDWYHRNCNGGESEHNRLECMCLGLNGTEEEVKQIVRQLVRACGLAGEVG